MRNVAVLRRCWLVPTYHGEAAFVDREKAVAYAVKWHSYVVNMLGQDDVTPPTTPQSMLPNISNNVIDVSKIDVDITTQVVGS